MIMAQISAKAKALKKWKKYVIKYYMIDVDEEDEVQELQEINTISKFVKYLKEIMDGAEEETLKGLSLVLNDKILKRYFKKAELDDYVKYAYGLYTSRAIEFNPLTQLLVKMRYKYKIP